jgi:hypothetical protein
MILIKPGETKSAGLAMPAAPSKPEKSAGTIDRHAFALR